MSKSAAVVGAAMFLMLGCGEPTQPLGPDEGARLSLIDGGVSPNMTIIGCEQDPECSEGGGGGGGSGGSTGDPNPSAPGYWMGTTVTPGQCFSPSGAGINDVDQDGMHDYCEEQLAQKFAPQLVFSIYDSWIGREPRWAAKYFPNHGNEVRVIYLLSYYGDAGVLDPSIWQALECPGATAIGQIWSFLTLSFHITSENVCEGHLGDSEFVVVDIIYSASTQHWMVQRVFYSAHYGTLNDRSSLVTYDGVDYADNYRGYPRVWVALGKHANYPTRSACENGFLSDDCEANGVSTAARVRSSPFYNVGSRVVNLVNKTESPGSCVSAESPYLPGVECYWWKPYEFFGWAYGLNENRPEGYGASSYAPFLVARFECYSYVLSGSTATCSDWGLGSGF